MKKDRTKPSQVEANRQALLKIMAMPEFWATIGDTLRVTYENSLIDLHAAKTPEDMFRAHGAFCAAAKLLEEIIATDEGGRISRDRRLQYLAQLQKEVENERRAAGKQPKLPAQPIHSDTEPTS